MKTIKDKTKNLLPVDELRNYIFTYLIDDEDFCKDVETLTTINLQNKSRAEKIDTINLHICNGCRGYLLRFLTLKYLKKLFIFEADYHLDNYWQEKLTDFLEKEKQV